MPIRQFFLRGDLKGAIAYMREHAEFKDIVPAYAAIFEDQKYRAYELPDDLNAILRLYQIYFRDRFYCGLPEAEAADRLLTGLRALLHMPDADEALLTQRLQAMFEAAGYHALFGKTQGYYGPYIWRDLSRPASGGNGGLYRQHPQGLRLSQLDGLSDLRAIRHGRLGLPRRHHQLHRAGL